MRRDKHKKILLLYELCIFALLGTLIFLSKLLMQALPNIHLVGMFTMVCAIVFGVKGLIPIYVYVFLDGLIGGFSMWWMPYLYVWTVLWGITMLLPRKMPHKVSAIVYPLVCGFHGLIFGILYSPAQAIMFGMDFDMTVKWIIAGLPFDALHCIGDLLAGILVLPISNVLKKLYLQIQRF